MATCDTFKKAVRTGIIKIPIENIGHTWQLEHHKISHCPWCGARLTMDDF